MWHSMFAEQIPLAEKILRTVVVYGLIAVLFRLTGKRGLGGPQHVRFRGDFLLSNGVQNVVICSALAVPWHLSPYRFARSGRVWRPIPSPLGNRSPRTDVLDKF
jgi:hypothetical protein